MADDDIRPSYPHHVDATLFRTLPSGTHRERRISITESARGKALAVDTYVKEGRRLPGTLYLFPRDIPAFLEALTDAAAAIGVEITAAEPARHLTRARAL